MPAAGRRIAGTVELRPTSPGFSKWPGWNFGLPRSVRSSKKEFTLPDGTTNEDGEAKLPLHLEGHAAPMLWARVKLEGFEADGGRGVRTELSTLVSRQSYLIGYHADRSLRYLDGKEEVAVKVVGIGPDAKPVVVAGLTRLLLETKYGSVLTKQNNGSFAYESK